MKFLFAILAILVVVFFILGRRDQTAAQDARDVQNANRQDHPESSEIVPPATIARAQERNDERDFSLKTNETSAPLPGEKSADQHAELSEDIVRDYTVEDGVAVIEGDIIIGTPGTAGRAAQVSRISPWPTREIPIYIQPSLPNPSRVRDAIEYFKPTAVRFVPYTNQHDVLVIESGTGRCKSYMGKIGGKQPIYLAPDCGAHEIAHELMHAIGFIHEQNRNDRDSFIRVNRENIEGSALANFEKLPTDFMILSGRKPFDFRSVMLYPETMFSRNGDPTIVSTTGAAIAPSEGLSASDIDRINSFYGAR